MTLRSCFLSIFIEFRSVVSEGKSKRSHPIIGQVGHPVFPIGQKNTSLVEDVDILLPVKFRWVPLSSFKGEVDNVSTNKRPGLSSCFSDRPGKKTNLIEDVEILLTVNFRWIPFSGFKGEVKNGSANLRPGRPACYSDRSKTHKLGRWRWYLTSCQVSLNSVQRSRRRSRKCLSQSEAGRPSCFSDQSKNTILVEDIQILLPIKFCWIQISGFRG